MDGKLREKGAIEPERVVWEVKKEGKSAWRQVNSR